MKNIINHIIKTLKHYSNKYSLDIASTILSDSDYLKYWFKRRMGYQLNLDSPKTFSEKLQWLKLNMIRPDFTILVDKIAVKDYVAKVIGQEYIIPTIGTWKTVNDIEWGKLPDQFVIKVNSDSGGIVVCKDKSCLDVNAAKKKLLYGWGRNYYKYNREYPYKNVTPRILAEKYMVDSSIGELRDYKFFCFNGQPKVFKIDFGRFVEHHANYYDINGKILPFGEKNLPPIYDKELPIPDNFSKMVDLATQIATHINHPFVRVDLYNVEGKIFFGEITFFPASGAGIFTSMKWDEQLGSYINLPL